ncbi:hypothetical protein HOO69_15565 (plasmid) [Vibrio europaeus]|uniref:Uncharacterized protein n=1 Tax=Vibrio europaeus TaxID=300876 RepID=A0AAE7DYX2_9VIBR|nr:hypothetical protein [Vibrio europaeus]QJY38005.1 hypothetical protein HOO69_15565 [Vibrio europaeus]
MNADEETTECCIAAGNGNAKMNVPPKIQVKRLGYRRNKSQPIIDRTRFSEVQYDATQLCQLPHKQRTTKIPVVNQQPDPRLSLRGHVRLGTLLNESHHNASALDASGCEQQAEIL